MPSLPDALGRTLGVVAARTGVHTRPARVRSVRAALRLLAGVVVIAAAGCSSEPRGAYYPLRGEVVSVAPERNEIVIRHDAIAGYMGAMAMPFPVARRQLLDGIAPGDPVEGVLLVEDGRLALVSLAKREQAAAPGAAAAPDKSDSPR